MTEPRARRRVPRRAFFRFVAMIALLAAAYWLYRDAALLDRLGVDQLGAKVEMIRNWWWSPLALIGLWMLLSPLGLPATPLLLAGGVVFGPWWGTLYNNIGASLGAATSFLFAHLLGRDLIAHLLGEQRVERLERLLDHYGFSSLVTIRLIPLPFAVTNFGAALVGVRFWPFVLATAIGIVPMVFVLTFLYATLGNLTTHQDSSAPIWLVAAIGLMTALALLRLYLRGRTARRVS